MTALQALLGQQGAGAPSEGSPFPSLLEGQGTAPGSNVPANSPFPTMPGMDWNAMQAGPTQKPLVERLFPLFHAFATVCLFLFVTLWWEPSVRTTRYGALETETNTQRWKTLSSSSPLSASGATEMLVRAPRQWGLH